MTDYSTLGAFCGRRLLMGAAEAGAGSLLAALAARWQLAEGTLAVATPTAAAYFGSDRMPTRIFDRLLSVDDAVVLIDEAAPDCVVLGASAGRSIEKALMVAARVREIPVVSFVDHYWNLWQRFADENTARPWAYVPDKIFVPAASCAERIVRYGAPPSIVSRFDHPLLRAAQTERRKTHRGVKRTGSEIIALFVSEYLFPPSSVWQWDQPDERDISGLLGAVLAAADHLSRDDQPVQVLIKLHPAEDDSRLSVCAPYPEPLYRVVRSTDKTALFEQADVAFGLNSMLLLEAANAGIPAYSHHVVESDEQMWLSTIRSEITELWDATDILGVLKTCAA